MLKGRNDFASKLIEDHPQPEILAVRVHSLSILFVVYHQIKQIILIHLIFVEYACRALCIQYMKVLHLLSPYREERNFLKIGNFMKTSSCCFNKRYSPVKIVFIEEIITTWAVANIALEKNIFSKFIVSNILKMMVNKRKLSQLMYTLTKHHFTIFYNNFLYKSHQLLAAALSYSF